MDMNDKNEHRLIKKCLSIIEDKLGWGNSEQWHSDVFVELSEAIQKETQVLLSPVTLKRVWGKVAYNSAPSISTLNTLSQFAGYRNWRDFKSRETAKPTLWIERRVSPNLGVIVLSASIMTIVFISLYSLTSSEKPAMDIDVSRVKFASKPLVSGLPNSVVFDFDLNGSISDSIYIQQYWDPTKIIKLSHHQTQATGQYYYPGYFRAKLVVDGVILKEHDLFIKSDSWMATLDYRPIPKYVYDENLSQDSLAFSKSISEEIKNVGEPLRATFHFVDDIPKLSGDDFSLQSSITSVYNDKWAVCQKMSIIIIGTKSAMVIPFSIPGCTSELSGMVSEKDLDGKTNDLSALGVDFTNERNIEVVSKDKLLSVYVDKREVFSMPYIETIGDIAGIRYRALGLVKITNVRLLDRIGKERILK